MSGQSKTGSFIEAVANIAVGVGVAFVSQLIIFGYYGIHISMMTNVKMTIFFTVVSLLRSFALRRFFNRLTVRKPYVRQYKYNADGSFAGESRWNNLARDGRNG